jgi:hypothetical protein
MAHDIFISYSHLDSEIRAQLCEELEIAKHSSFWFDQKGIKGGQVWKDKIFEALLESNIVILLASNNSLPSKEIALEVNYAIDELKKTIIPVLIEAELKPCTLKMRLHDFHWIDAHSTDPKNRFINLIKDLDERLESIQKIDEKKSANEHLANTSKTNEIYDVFIRYAGEDSIICNQLRQQLDAAGISYWNEVPNSDTGESFTDFVHRAISASKTIILLASKKSLASALIAQEINLALEMGKNVIPVSIEAISEQSYPLKSALMGMPWIDATNPNSTNRFSGLLNQLKTLGIIPKQNLIISATQNGNKTEATHSHDPFSDDYIFFTLGRMTAKEVLQGPADWIETIVALEEKSKSYVLKTLKGSPDKTVFELMAEYNSYLHDPDTYDLNLSDIEESLLTEGLANLLNLEIEVVKNQISTQPKNTLARELFKKEWPCINKESVSDNPFDLFALGKMIAKQVLQGSPEWLAWAIETLSNYEEKSEPLIINTLKSSPDKTVFELMPEYNRCLHDKDYYDENVKCIQDYLLAGGLANLLNLPIAEVKDRMAKERSNKLIKNIFKNEWPDSNAEPDDIDDDEDVPSESDIPDYLKLGKMTVEVVLNHDKHTHLIDLISRYARKSSVTIKKYLKNSDPNEIIDNAVKDYGDYINPYFLGSTSVSMTRNYLDLTSAIVITINNKKITAQHVEERLIAAHSNKLIKNVFSDVWPS